MKFVHAAALMSVLCAVAGLTAATTAKTTAARKVTSPVRKATSSAKKASPSARKSTGKTVASSSPKTRLAKGKTTKAPAATWRTRQQNPTPDRYREIQQALVDKGYLKGEPSGVWDADSVGAMQRFQLDQKLTPNGKITAPALIGLGLGAKSAGAPEAAPLPSKPDTPGAQPPNGPPPAAPQ